MDTKSDTQHETAQSPLDQVRERARRQFVEAGALMAIGAAAFGAALVTINSEEVPDWIGGASLGVYTVAAVTGGIRYLASADSLLELRDFQRAAGEQTAAPTPPPPTDPTVNSE